MTEKPDTRATMFTKLGIGAGGAEPVFSGTLREVCAAAVARADSAPDEHIIVVIDNTTRSIDFTEIDRLHKVFTNKKSGV